MKITFSILLFAYVLALFKDDSAVIKLTKNNFKTQVLESQFLWLVQFYGTTILLAPWCGHCKASAPQFEKAAEILQGMVRIGAVDMTTDGVVGQPYGVSSYPTIKFFGQNKTSPLNYQGDRTFDKFTQYSMKKASRILNKRYESLPKQGSDDL